jgi:hypothetical protein
MVEVKPGEETRRTPSGEEGVEEWELGVPPAPARRLEDRPEFQAAVVQLKQALRPGERPFDEESRVSSDLPPAPSSELRLHAEARAMPAGKVAPIEGPKVAVAPRVDPRRAVTARIPREPKPWVPGVPLSPLPPAMPPSDPVPAEQGARRRWGAAGVLLVLATVGVLVAVSQIIPHGKGAAAAPAMAASAGATAAASTATTAPAPVIDDRPPASSPSPSSDPPTALTLRPEPLRPTPRGSAPNDDPYDASPPPPPAPPKTATPTAPPAPVLAPAPVTAGPLAPKPSSTPPASPAEDEIFHRPKPRADNGTTP